MVKNLPAMQKTWIRSLGQEDTLEKETAIHSRILAGRIPWTEETGRLLSMGSQDWDARLGFNQMSLLGAVGKEGWVLCVIRNLASSKERSTLCFDIWDVISMPLEFPP